MEEEIVNKVASSGLVNIDLEDFYPAGRRMTIDLTEVLFQGLILREKDFREWLKTHNWEQYRDSYVAVFCSTDAIIPIWAYMLVSASLEGLVKKSVLGTLKELETSLYQDIIQNMDILPYIDQRVIIKGCGNLPVPESAYVMLTNRLRPVAKSIMYGEACSTVPVYKKGKSE
jgi:hypothetical protein